MLSAIVGVGAANYLKNPAPWLKGMTAGGREAVLHPGHVHLPQRLARASSTVVVYVIRRGYFAKGPSFWPCVVPEMGEHGLGLWYTRMQAAPLF